MSFSLLYRVDNIPDYNNETVKIEDNLFYTLQ